MRDDGLSNDNLAGIFDQIFKYYSIENIGRVLKFIV